MSKSARDTLFGITLTELIIILFFIMLLLAIFNIEDLTDQIPEDTEDIVPASTVVDLLIPDGEINSDLIPLDVIADEIRKLHLEVRRVGFELFLHPGEQVGDVLDVNHLAVRMEHLDEPAHVRALELHRQIDEQANRGDGVLHHVGAVPHLDGKPETAHADLVDRQFAGVARVLRVM